MTRDSWSATLLVPPEVNIYISESKKAVRLGTVLPLNQTVCKHGKLICTVLNKH